MVLLFQGRFFFSLEMWSLPLKKTFKKMTNVKKKKSFLQKKFPKYLTLR